MILEDYCFVCVCFSNISLHYFCARSQLVFKNKSAQFSNYSESPFPHHFIKSGVLDAGDMENELDMISDLKRQGDRT